MQIVRGVEELRQAVKNSRSRGERLALVPTMGALHAGHLALVTEGKKHAERVAASIFVNPTQFAAHEDLGRYPRQEAEDAAMLEEGGCDLLWLPAVADVYPDGFATTVRVGAPRHTLCVVDGELDRRFRVAQRLRRGADAVPPQCGGNALPVREEQDAARVEEQRLNGAFAGGHDRTQCRTPHGLGCGEGRRATRRRADASAVCTGARHQPDPHRQVAAPGGRACARSVIYSSAAWRGAVDLQTLHSRNTVTRFVALPTHVGRVRAGEP